MGFPDFRGVAVQLSTCSECHFGVGVATFLIGTYLACILLTAGLAKLNNPIQFAASLNFVKGLAPKIIKLASLAVPCLEITLALALISGLLSLATALINLLVFVSFFFFKLLLFNLRFSADCGCFGTSYQNPIDLANLTVSLIFVGLAAAYFWLNIWIQPVHLFVRAPIVIAFITTTGLTAWRITRRQKPNRLLGSGELLKANS